LARFPTTAKIAALSILLALLTNIILIGFIRFQTQDDAMAVLHERVMSNVDVALDVFDNGGMLTLRKTLIDTANDDQDIVFSILDKRSRVVDGNIVALAGKGAIAVGRFETGLLRRADMPRPALSGYVKIALDKNGWLIIGRMFDDHLTLQNALEQSLLVALGLSLIMGIVGGVAIARYVGTRVSRIAAVVDDVGAGDFARRADVTGSGDAFDVLSMRINHMLGRVTALMDELRILTDGLAHDLRSPVSRLRARVEQALGEPNQVARDRLLGGALDEADALTRMLAIVLEIGRSEAMAGAGQFLPLDPTEFITEIAEIYEPLAEEIGLELNVRSSGSPRLVSVHRQLLAQAISNLLDNAFNYGASGRVVTLFSDLSSTHLSIGVADNGSGIAAADLDEARKRFGRLDASRTVPGAGLGLSLAEAVAHLHKGSLVLGANNPGLRAAICIPL
jgi:signal transduction histidine kinase